MVLLHDAKGLLLEVRSGASAALQLADCPPRRLRVYGSTNKYNPLNMSKASGSSGE
jgi:hypothetical protein